ncbi:MAG: Gfo/Idh/MocA family oxidoreductase [Pirellulaceae bacterium]|nr:Gfo/Idh/MocA family oxidoreductase [Pirellulaceae bacterium]
MLRLAFLGIDHPHGAHWRQMLANFAGEAEIVAFVPEFGGGTASLEERHANVPRFDTASDLLRWGQFDGAVVCLSNRTGPPAMIELAQAGKHILAEKPVAAGGGDARRIAAAVEKSGVAFQAGYMWRYDDIVNRLRRMVRQGAFGQFISLEMTFATSDIARRGAGHYLFDPVECGGAGFFSWLSCHFLDAMFYVVGRPVVGVTARTGVFGAVSTAMEDGGSAIFDLEGGGLATFTGGYWLPRWAGESRWALRGSQRWIHWDAARKGTGGVLEIHGPQPQWHAMEETFIAPADKREGYGGDKGFAMILDWLDCIRTGRRDQRNGPRPMQTVLELIDAIYQSSREGRRVECRIGP